MEINKIVKLIENFAPLDTQEEWDSSGYQVYFENRNINKILLSLSITENILQQAIENNCDMIISHHPFLFPHAVPISYNKNIPIYSAHTNLDKAEGGTTDTLIETLGFCQKQSIGEFLRIVDLQKEISLDEFVDLVKDKLVLQNVRVVNNLNQQKISKIAFCAGSGVEFLVEAVDIGADAFVTGDVKYHTALDSNVIIIDVGHFESEVPVLGKLKNLLENVGLEVLIADEKSPFINY